MQASPHLVSMISSTTLFEIAQWNEEPGGLFLMKHSTARRDELSREKRERISRGKNSLKQTLLNEKR